MDSYQQQQRHQEQHTTSHILLGAAKKGFGSTPEPTPSQAKKKKNKGQPQPQQQQQQTMATPVGTIPQDDNSIMGDDGITFINPYANNQQQKQQKICQWGRQH